MSNSVAPALRPSPQLSPAASPPVARPDSEVVARPARAQRRQFTVAFKRRILDEAAHTAIGQLGALLRREGLYSSHLTNWRRQRAQGTLAAPRRRGQPATSSTERELVQLRVEHARLARKLAAAELVIEVQKKVAALLGLDPTDATAPPMEPAVAPPVRRGRST